MSGQSDRVIDILRATDDGNDLAPEHLAFVEAAVNGMLNEEGERALVKMHREIMSKGYTRPWFHGVENMERCQEGYVYWKGEIVEHYSAPWCYSDEARESAEELAERCKVIEARGEFPDTNSAVYFWQHGHNGEG